MSKTKFFLLLLSVFQFCWTAGQMTVTLKLECGSLFFGKAEITYVGPNGTGMATKVLEVKKACDTASVTLPLGSTHISYRVFCTTCLTTNWTGMPRSGELSRITSNYTLLMKGNMVAQTLEISYVDKILGVNVLTCLVGGDKMQLNDCKEQFPKGSKIKLGAMIFPHIPAGSRLTYEVTKVSTGTRYTSGIGLYEQGGQSVYGERLMNEAGDYILSYFNNDKPIGTKRFSIVDQNAGNTNNSGNVINAVKKEGGPNNYSPTTRITALQQAIQNSEFETAEDMIIRQGANVNLRDSVTGRTAIHYAALTDDKNFIQLLKNRGNADINIRDNQNKTALDLALESSKFSAAKALLENNADASLASAGLDRVLATDNKEILRLMLQNGADANVAIKKAIARDNAESMKFVFDNSSARASNALFEEAINMRSTKCAVGLLQNGIDKNQALDFVIQKKEKQMVDLVLSTGVDVQMATKAMLFAIEQRDLNMVESTITTHNANVNAGMPIAVINNHVQMVNLLLKNHADPNDQMDEAAASGKTEIVNSFLMAGANPDNGVRPAAENGRIAILQTLLDNNGDANLAMPVAMANNNSSMVKICLNAKKPADVFRSEYVVTACQNSNLEILTALLLAGAPPDPGMLVSIQKAHVGLVDALIKAGASVNRPDYMSTAGKVNSISVIKLLLDAGADPKPGFPYAAENGNLEAVDMMLAKGANAEDGLLPAVRSGSVAVAERLISKGANAGKPEIIMASVPHNNAALTRLLIDNGANSALPLNQSVMTDKFNIVSLLIEKSVDVKDPKYLGAAVSLNHVRTATVLVDKGGADPHYVNDKGLNYFQIASRAGCLDMLGTLSRYKVDPNRVDGNGNTALMEMMLSKDIKIKNGTFQNVLTTMLNAGCDPNIANASGEIALHLLCKGDMKNNLREDCIVALLNKGANPCIKDKNNKIARDYLPGMEGGPRRKLKEAMKNGDCK